jgi:hypothetical protein
MSNQSIPSLSELTQYNVNRANAVEAIKWSLYDSLTYAAAGQSQLQFFQVPKGQSGKTYANTNMTAAGALPSPQSFLIQTIELSFFPGENPALGAGTAATANSFVNDNWKFWSQPAYLELYIGSKAYLDEAPLMKFPPRNGLGGFSSQSDSTTAGATQLNQIGYASAGGPIYEVNPPILLVPTQNFSVTLYWPTLVTITNAATVYCNLGGVLYRNSQ